MKKSVLIWGLLGVMVCVTGCADKSKIKAEDYISLGEYEGLEVTRVSTEVTDEEIQQQIDSILSDYATTEEITDRTDVQEGDVVNIDYTGTLDGEVFDGGSAQGFDLEIGSGRFIDGFEEGLIGADVGDTVTLNLTFPGEYSNNPDLAGKDVVFAVKINSISKSELPEFNDAFIAQESSGQFSTVVDFKAYMTEQMESSRKEYADSIMYTELLDEAVDNAEVIKDIPEEYVQEKIDEMIRTTKSGAEAYGMDFDT
ncbi:MAG TPA: trigger factor, partial [Lachnospiraceae bacterium]|nr:trigger factor [Lachnospiraceae bacterium]